MFEGPFDPSRDHNERVANQGFQERDAAQHPVEPRERRREDIEGEGAFAKVDPPLGGDVQVASPDGSFRKRDGPVAERSAEHEGFVGDAFLQKFVVGAFQQRRAVQVGNDALDNMIVLKPAS